MRPDTAHTWSGSGTWASTGESHLSPKGRQVTCILTLLFDVGSPVGNRASPPEKDSTASSAL